MVRYLAVILMWSVLYLCVSVCVCKSRNFVINISYRAESTCYIMVHASQLYHIRQVLYEKSIELGNMDWLKIWLPSTSNIGTKSKNLHVSRLVLQLSLPNPLKPGVTSGMKMSLEQRRQAMLQHLHEWSTIVLLTKVPLILEVWWYIYSYTKTVVKWHTVILRTYV